MTIITKIAAIATALVIGHAAAAQDYTGMDVTALNEAWNLNRNTMMNEQLNQIIWQNMNDPNVQMYYQQQVAQGLFWGTLEEFAFKYAALGGDFNGGQRGWMDTSTDLNGKFVNQMAGANANSQGYYDAYGNWVAGYANNQGQMGTIMLGN